MSNKKLLKSTLKLERLSIHHRPASLFRKRLFAISLIKMCGFCFHLPVQERLSHRGSAGNDKWIVHPDEQPHDGMIEILPDPFEETGTSTSNAFHIVGFNFWKTWVFFYESFEHYYYFFNHRISFLTRPKMNPNFFGKHIRYVIRKSPCLGRCQISFQCKRTYVSILSSTVFY